MLYTGLGGQKTGGPRLSIFIHVEPQFRFRPAPNVRSACSAMSIYVAPQCRDPARPPMLVQPASQCPLAAPPMSSDAAPNVTRLRGRFIDVTVTTHPLWGAIDMTLGGGCLLRGSAFCFALGAVDFGGLKSSRLFIYMQNSSHNS